MIVYRIFNKKNNKSYIGQSIHSFNKRYKGNWIKHTHNLILKNAVNKHGIENFDFEILIEGVQNIEKLNELEQYYAEKFNSYRPSGYNIRGCGDNKFTDDIQKKQLASFRLGREYSPKNKISSKYKGVYWRESKKSWMCRFQNSIIKKDKYVSSEIEAAEMYDKISLHLIGKDCYINFENKRQEYLNSNLEEYYNSIFMKEKPKRKDGYFKDDSEFLILVKPLIWKMSIPKIAKHLNTTIRRVNWCIKKHNLEHPGKNYWQKQANT